MKTSKQRFQRLLVLVPHRDVRRQLRSWSASLFAAGLYGAWSFPWVAPLAKLNRFLSAEELKRLARSLRQGVKNAGGKFLAGSSATATLANETLFVFGPALDIELPDSFFDDASEAVVSPILPLVLGSAVLFGTRDANNSPIPSPQSTLPKISFRAAALANMSYRVLTSGNSLYFNWKIGPLHWLPKTLPSIRRPTD